MSSSADLKCSGFAWMTIFSSALISAVLKSSGTTSVSFSLSEFDVFEVISSRFISGSDWINLSVSFADVVLRLSLKMLKVLGVESKPSIAFTVVFVKSSLLMSR